MNEMIEKVGLNLIEIEKKISLIENDIELLKMQKQQLTFEKKKVNTTLSKLEAAKESYDDLEKM